MAGTSETPWPSSTFMDKVLAIAPTIIYVFNQKTQSNEYSNRSLGEMLGYEPEEIQAMGDAFMPTLAHPSDLPKIGEHFAGLHSLADGDVAEILYRIRHKDGHWVWLLSYDTVFEREPNGDLLRHVGIAADVTVRIESEAKVHRSKDRLVAANEELSELAYVVSHDMRAPIVNIAQLARAIETNLPASDSDSRQMIDLILRSCSQAEKRIQAVVTVAQNSDTLIPDTPTRTLVDDAVQASLEELAPAVEVSDATISSRVPADLAVSVPMLPLQTVLVNLLTNAIIHRDAERSPVITLDAAVDEQTITLTVTDNGPGIDDTDRERVFELFQRGTNATGEGSGVGLYLVRQMARRAGGDVTAANNPDGGAVFALTFPVMNDV